MKKRTSIKTCLLVMIAANIFIFTIMTVNITNAQVLEDTIQVGAGWNIVGSLNNGIPFEILRSEPPDIITTAFFRYNPGGGYEAKDTLERGMGYWIKVSEDGLIIFNVYYENACPGIPRVYYDGKIYNTVIIGSQCWLRENLNIGTMVPGSDTARDNGIFEKHCYNNDTANCNTYGGLYQWNEAMQYSTTPGTRGICPEGWHLPTFSEFQTLETAVGDDGNALKAVGQGGGPGAGANTSGFSALLAGTWTYSGGFVDLSYYGIFLSSTGGYSVYPWAFYLTLSYDDSRIIVDSDENNIGYSVRCLKD